MEKERLFIPIMILFIVGAFAFGLIYFYKNIKPITSVLSKKDVICNEMSLIEAIELAKESDCTDAGAINEDIYICHEGENRLDISIDVIDEKKDICAASCYIYTDSKETYLQWMCRGRGLLE